MNCLTLTEEQYNNLCNAKKVLQLVGDLVMDMPEKKRLDIEAEAMMALVLVLGDLLP